MELERIAAAVRPRTAWEAMDLGLHMARRWYAAILGPWLVLIGGLVALLVSIFPHSPGWALLGFWLLKPLYDRLPLYVLSRALFGAVPGWGETLAALPLLLARDLPWTLLHRIDSVRSFNLPVRQLEGLRGRTAARRMRALQRRTRGHAVGLTGLFLLLELLGFLSLLWLGPLLLPPEPAEELLAVAVQEGALRGWLAWVLVGAYMAAVTLLEPFYVAAGFGLYLNRRTELEAWDVELQFRRLSRRAGPQALRGAGTALALAAALAAAPPAPAAETAPAPPVHPVPRPEEQAKATIEAVLQQPVFDRYREIEGWSYVGDRDEPGGSGEWGFGISPLLGRLVELLLWGALLVGAGLLLIHRRRWLPYLGRRRRKAGPRPPEVLFGLDIRPESLPPDLPGEARRLRDAGELRQALSLLYRGALAALVHRFGLALGTSDTEGECLAKVQGAAGAELSAHFRRLTSAWQAVAYAHRPPERSGVDALIDGWDRHFGDRA